MTPQPWIVLDSVTSAVGSQVWTALQNGTALVLLTLLITWALGRRLPVGVHALLWTFALVKFVVPCGPSIAGSFSRGLQLAGEPLGVSATSVLNAAEHPLLLSLKVAAVSLYVVVVVALAARAADRYARYARGARRLPEAPAATVALVVACAQRLGMKRLPSVRVSDKPVSPHVAGVLRPVLVLPRWLADRGDAEEAFVLHELAHLARRDHWLLVVIAAVEITFFFWPPVRYAASRLRFSREAACDAAAVNHGPLGAAAYARSLVGAARCLAGSSAGGLVASVLGSRLEERVDFLIVAARPARARRPWLALLLAVWGIWVLSGAAAPLRATSWVRLRPCTGVHSS